MITDSYIESFKKSHPFNIISKGILNGDIVDVIEGNNDYRVFSKNDMENTVPSLVLITIHILIVEGNDMTTAIKNAFKNVFITENNVCLYLAYIEAYLIYVKNHNEVEIDYKYLYQKIIEKQSEYDYLYCFNIRTESIKNLMV